jgi:hypothetical protein
MEVETEKLIEAVNGKVADLTQ